MKKRKKVCILLLAALLCAALLSGCGTDYTKALVGKWQYTWDLADDINEGFESEGLEEYLHIDSLPVSIRYTFNSDKTYSCTVDEAGLSSAIEEVKTTLKNGLTAYADDMIAEQGLEELGMSAEELFQAMGTSLDDMVDQALPEELLSELMAEVASEGNFEAEADKLYTSDGLEYGVDPEAYEVYEMSEDGSTLTLVKSVGGDVDNEMSDLYPLTLKKVG